MLKTFQQSGRNKGLVTNLPSDQVAWAIGRNVEFRPGMIYKTLGKSLLATVPNQSAIREIFTFKDHLSITRHIVCTDRKLYCYTNDFGTVVDITPTVPPTSGALDPWTFALIGGVPIVNNSVDTMWKWDDFLDIMKPVLNAPTRAGVITKVNQRLVAGNLQDIGGIESKNRIRWTFPHYYEIWEVDRTLKADYQELTDPDDTIHAAEEIIGFGLAGDRSLVFSDFDVWDMKAVQSKHAFSFHSPYGQRTLLSARARANVRGLCYFMGWDDFYVISSEGIESIGFDIRNIVFANINGNAISTCFAFWKPATRQVVFCYPTGINTVPDTAAIYQYETKTWTFTDVNYLCHNFSWKSQVSTIEDLPFGEWDQIPDARWDLMDKNGLIPYDIVGRSDGKILKMDDGFDDINDPIAGYIETGDLGSEETRMMINQIVPILKPQENKNAIMVQVGSREALHGPIYWGVPQEVLIGIDRKADALGIGRYNRIRFFSDQSVSPWILSGYMYNFVPLGG